MVVCATVVFTRRRFVHKKTMSNSMKNTCSNTADRVTDLRKRILSVFAGSIVDRRFDTIRPRSLRDNKESVLFRLVSTSKLNDSLSSSF